MTTDRYQDVQALITRGEFDTAIDACRQMLNESPEDTEALYMKAVCHRYQGNFDEALEALSILKAITPENGRAFQEEGHVYRETRSTDMALQAYARACQYNPALLASWRAQLKLLVSTGRQPQIDYVNKRLTELEALPKPLLGIMDLLSQGKLLKAEEYCRQFLQKVPHHVEAMRLLAQIGVRLGVMDDAEFLLESAASFAPDNVQVRIDYIQTLRKKQKFAAALEQADYLLKTEPDNLQFQSLYAIESMQTGDYEKAIALFDTILERAPGDPLTLTSKGHALKTIGNSKASIECYADAIASQPTHGEAYYSLANLKTYVFDNDYLSQMLAQSGNPNLSYMDRVYINFALGKAFEDRGEFEQSFQHYGAGNQLKKAQSRYSAQQMTEEFEKQKAICTPALMARRQNSGCPAPDPIFILGLPRAGSTLLEQILASHSQVDGTLELPNILSLSHRLRRGDKIEAESKYPEVLPEIDDGTLRAYGEAYIEETRIHRQDAPFFIDKMPNNFRHIGLIKLILPNAKIIDARRQPMSCCFSGFKQLFAEGQEFSYSLEDIGHYYRDYVALMDHWHSVLPGEILTVNHEAVVDDLEKEVRRILSFCELPFEQSCLEYYETERSIRTPSSEQVRQPIFRDNVDAWQNFDAWLQPLKSALGPQLVQTGHTT